MQAITVRDGNGMLLCWGPLNRSYDPGVPEGAVKAVEDSYDAVVAEYAVLQANTPVVLSLEAKVATLEAQVATLNEAMVFPGGK
jgi:hypothetical protein